VDIIGGVSMKNNKKALGGSLCVITIFLIQVMLKATGATNFSMQITVTVILMLIMCVLISIDFILSESIPQIVKTHRSLSIGMDILAVSSVLAFVIFSGVAASITAKKKQR
jgi:hypothetical protein